MENLKHIKNLDNLSLVIHGPGDLRLEQTPIKEKLEEDGQSNRMNRLNLYSFYFIQIQSVCSKRIGISLK